MIGRKLFAKLFGKPEVAEEAPEPVATEVKTSAPETKKSVEQKEQPARPKIKIPAKKNKNK